MFNEVGEQRPLVGTWVRTLARLVGLLTLLGATGALWLVTSPVPWTLLAERLVRDLPGELEIASIDLTGPGDPLNPSTWEITLEGVRWTPTDQGGPRFTATRLVAPLPDWAAWQQRRAVTVPWARVVGLHLEIPEQRPPPPWEVSDDPLTLGADRVEVWDTRFTVHEDDPLVGLAAEAIYAELESVSFCPGTRDFRGLGHARVGPIQYGDLPIDGATVGQIVADERGVVLDGVAYRLAAGSGLATLRFEGLLKSATAMGLDTEVTSLRIQDIVSATSDRPSPIRGRVSAEAAMQTDLAAERGTSVLTAQVRIPELFIPLDLRGEQLGPVLRGALELFGYTQGAGLRIRSLYGPISLGRGWVTVDGLRSTVLGVPIEVKARIDQGKTWILVRRLPRLRNLGTLSRVTGAVGLVIEGHGDDLWLRVADEAEMRSGRQVGRIRKEGVKVSD